MKYGILLLVVLIFSACTTAYGPANWTGGYKERMLDEDSYIVSFFGNGNTPEQQVWNYWIYRCAELTLEKGYELFSLTPSSEHALLNDPDSDRLLQFEMLDSHEGSDDQGRFTPVQYYYYSVTTYSSKAVVNMYNAPFPEGVDVELLLDAQTILNQLRPYVESNAKVSAPDRKILFIRASIEAVIKAQLLDEEKAEKLRSLQI